MQVLLVVNPSAGRGRAQRMGELAQVTLRTSGIGVEMVVGDQRTLSERIAEGVGGGVSAVIACGGDGTVHRVTQTLAGTACALGIIPTGTGNDNARSLGVPLHDPHRAAAAIVEDLRSGQHTLNDVATVQCADGTHRLVLGVISTGFDSSVNAWANARTWPSGTPKYVLGLMRLLPFFRPLDYRIVVDGRQLCGDGMLVSVGNGPTYGGGMQVCPQARRDDGLLDVMWLAAVGRARFLAIFPRVYAGSHTSHPRVRMLLGRSVIVDAAGQTAYGDGELIGPLPIIVEAWSGAIRVVGGGRA